MLLLGGGGAVAALFFVGRPVVASVEPQRARVGDTIALSGERFADPPAGNTVLFGTHQALPSGGSAGRLEVRIPDLGLAPGQESRIDVRVRVGRKASAAVALMVRESPRVSRLSPDIGLPGEEVLVGGGGWGTTGVVVTFNDVPAPIVDAKPTFVKVRVPPLTAAAGTLVRVVVSQGEDRSAPAAFILGRLPVITAVEPKSASLGDIVTLRGRGFRASAPEHVARIGGALALVTGVSVTGASDGAIQVMVPAEAPGGEAPIEVRVRGYENPATALLAVSPAVDPVELRFSAEPDVDGGGRLRAAVTTGLGPAFVLSAAGGRTAAQRATEAVARLNAAVAALKAAGESAIEMRARGSSSAIALNGAQEALIEVSDEDAAAYQAEAAAQRVKAPAVTRGRLATWWAALLGDLVLALGRSERPRQAAALAPEGRALGELFDAATKGGAPGITRAGWAAGRPAVRDGVRALAFRVPATVTEPPGRMSSGGPAPGQAGLTPS